MQRGEDHVHAGAGFDRRARDRSVGTQGKTVVALRGELDASTAPQLFEVFARLSRSGATQVELDLSQLGAMDSSGLSVVVAEHKRTKHDGGGLVILSPNRRVIRMFQLSGLMSYFVVHPKMSV